MFWQVGRRMVYVGGSPHQALDRPPLRESALRRAVELDHCPWRDVRVLEETGSTNADALAAAAAGAPEGLVIIAERQVSGRGRLARTWEAPARTGLTFSVLLRPAGVAPPLRGWLPLLAGVAVAEAIRRVAEIDAMLKWPNDVIINDRKVGGILVEMQPHPAGGPDAAVVGVGVNVTQREDELPVPTATSLMIESGGGVDRDTLLRAILGRLATHYTAWREGSGKPDAGSIRTRYCALCATLGRSVQVSLPAGQTVEGVAEGIDGLGQLVLRSDSGRRSVGAGDVIHVR